MDVILAILFISSLLLFVSFSSACCITWGSFFLFFYVVMFVICMYVRHLWGGIPHSLTLSLSSASHLLVVCPLSLFLSPLLFQLVMAFVDADDVVCVQCLL